MRQHEHKAAWGERVGVGVGARQAKIRALDSDSEWQQKSVLCLDLDLRGATVELNCPLKYT